jgi:KaiC/GvpD/RAD55 family RecA-like ATPase
MNISIYKDSHDNTGALIDLPKALRLIKSGRFKDQVVELQRILMEEGKDAYNREKKSLNSVTFSGTFQPTRHDAHCQQYTGLVTCDIDGITQDTLDDLRDALTLDRHTLCYFNSPSGNGLKVLVPVSSKKEDHYSAFECVRLYFLENYQVKLDPSGKNLSRLCYLSHDPDLYYNGEAEPMTVEVSESVRARVYGDREVYSKDNKITTNDLKVYDICRQWAEMYKPYQQGGRNSHIHTCSCNLNRCGMSLENAILSIARDRTDLPIDEIKETVRRVYKAKLTEFNTITIFDFEKEQDIMRGAMEMSSPADIIDQIASSSSETLITSGYNIQDKTFGGGKERGAVYAYIGREKTYKSVHAIQEACTLSMSGVPVLYLNGEMSKRQFMQIVAQQRLSIPRTKFNDNLKEIREWADINLKNLSVVTGRDFSFERIIKSVEAIRTMTGSDVAQVFVDGISHMDACGREEIQALIENSKVLKEVAKSCNEGRMAAVTVLIHTDAACNYWSRKPQSFIRGKTKVLSNFDGSVGFSRFIVEGSMNEDWSDFELRNDIYNIRVEDYRLTGESNNIVMHLDSNCTPTESSDDASVYEFNPKKQNNLSI